MALQLLQFLIRLVDECFAGVVGAGTVSSLEGTVIWFGLVY